MKSLNKLSICFNIMLVSAACLVLTAGGCPGGKEKVVDKCINAPANDCAAYKQNDGKACELDSDTNKCRVKTTPQTNVCQKISDKDECQKNDLCLYQNNKCDKAADNEAGTCAAIKVDTFCNAHTSSKDKKPCMWDAGACKNKPTIISEYTLKKLSNEAAITTDYNLPDDKIKGITAAKNGEHVYLIGTEEEMFRAFSVDDNVWGNALGNFNGIRKATALNDPLNWAGSKISKFEPLSDGILVWISGKGLVQIIGSGTANSFGWARESSNLKKTTPAGMGEITTSAGTFLYLSMGENNPKVLFVPKKTFAEVNTAYPANWDNTLVAAMNQIPTPPTAITKLYKQFLPYPAGNGMLMLQSKGENADLVKDGNIGLTDRWIINKNLGADDADQGQENYLNYDPAFDPGASGTPAEIQKLAMVDKWLVAIFIPSNDPNDATGGIALFDTTAGADPLEAASWQWLNNGAKTLDITVDKVGPKKDKRAVITTRIGLMILDEDKLIEPVAGEGNLINDALTAKKAVTSGATPKSGFTGDEFPAALNQGHSYLNAVQDKNGLWYIAIRGSDGTDGGVFTLDIKEITAAP